MPDITFNIIDLPSTNNAWGFGGARNKKGFTPTNETFDDDNSWVFGIACYRHTGESAFLRNRSLHIDRQCGSKNTAMKYITEYYKKLNKTVAFNTK